MANIVGGLASSHIPSIGGAIVFVAGAVQGVCDCFSLRV